MKSKTTATSSEEFNKSQKESETQGITTKSSVGNAELLSDDDHLTKFASRFKKKLKPGLAIQHVSVFSKEINSSWNKCVEGILETGYLLTLAKQTLGDLEKFGISFKIEARKKILPQAYI